MSQPHSLVSSPLRAGLLTAAVLVASLLGGCAVNGAGSAPAAQAPAKAEDAVRDRAQARWKLLLTEDFDKAYAYLTPAYRNVNTASAYRGRFGNGAKWMGADVKSVECPTEDRCLAVISLQSLVVARGFSGPITTTPTETWLKEDGQWYYYQN
ncbi:MAG: hypothetical protein PHI55_02405 [Burkholderiaceae bacterium]|nr:hypothetical protein [Burkholderiaceae bacterium]